MLAIARSNCSIEIWLTSSWTQLLVIAGNKSSAIRRLHWLSASGDGPSDGSWSDELNPLMFRGAPRRLLTTGLNGVVLEWDLITRAIK